MCEVWQRYHQNYPQGQHSVIFFLWPKGLSANVIHTVEVSVL